MARPKGRTILVLKCENCGNEVRRRKGQERVHTFCSRECYWKSDYRSESVAARNAERNPLAWFTAPCGQCGTPVSRHASRRPKVPFCSRECHRAYKRGASKRQITSGGYVRVFVGLGYPGAAKSGHMFEHRKVMQDHLGRPLLPDENVHHINGVRDDNRLANLELWSHSQPKGQRVTDKIRWARDFLALYEGALDG